MNTLLKAAAVAAVASFAVAASANAAITPSTAAGPYGAPGGENLLHSFDGAQYLSGDYSLVQGSVTGVSEAPYLDDGKYLVVPGTQSAEGTAKLNLTSFLAGKVTDGLTFYWGSVDSYNTLDILDRSGNILKTIKGDQVGVPNNLLGSPTSTAANILFHLTFTGDDRANFGGLQFTSSQKAFEIDHLTIATSAVPEPATWAMMIAGFGLAGAAIRRRRTAFAAA